MINVTATSESAPQVLYSNRVYNASGTWWEIRLVGWIFQNTSDRTTTLYFKWQTGSNNYYPYSNEQHLYSVSLDGQSVEDSFSLPLTKSNAYIDKSPVKTLAVTHNANSAYTGTISVNGYKCWEEFSFSDTIKFKAITESTPDQSTKRDSVPYINDEDPKFYILADGQVLYSMNDESHFLMNPKLTLELNQVDSLDFTVPPTNALYSDLLRLKTTIEVKQGKEILFRGRILTEDTDFYNQKDIHCEGALSFLGDTLLYPYKESDYATAADFFEAAMLQHFSQVPESTPTRRLLPVRCNVSSAIELSNDSYSTTSEMISTLLSEVGGFIKLEYYEDGETGISYLNSAEHTSSQVIDFGENLTDLAKTIDASGIFTAVFCEGGYDTNRSSDDPGERPHVYVEDGESIATFGKIVRTFTYDDIAVGAEVSEGHTLTEDEVYSQLQEMALYQLLIGTQLTYTISVKAIDLHLIFPAYEKIRIGDYVRLRSKPHEIDSYFQCTRIDIDMQNPENTVYTFGGTMPALTDNSKGTSKQTASAPAPSNVVSYYQSPTNSMYTSIASNGPDWTNILFITDMHSDLNQQHSQDIALYLLRNSKIKFAVLNGDFCKHGYNETYYKAYTDKLLSSDQKSKIFATLGNHDADIDNSYDYIPQARIASDFLTGKSIVAGNFNEAYYYFDDSSKKVRYLFINTSNGADWLSASTDEIAWIATAVNLPDASWSLMIFGHENLDDVSLSSHVITSGSDSMTCRNGAAVLSAVGQCNGTIIGYFCGHQHIDRTDVISAGSKSIHQTMMICDKLENEPYYDNFSYPSRSSGNTSEQAISIISVNTKSKNVVIRRIGAGSSNGLSYTY